MCVRVRVCVHVRACVMCVRVLCARVKCSRSSGYLEVVHKWSSHTTVPLRVEGISDMVKGHHMCTQLVKSL